MEIQQFKGSLQDLFNQATNKEKIEQARVNRTKNKTINVLCFMPAQGGHFLATLLALNSDTVPLKPIENDSQRVDVYKYNPLVAPLLDWTGYYYTDKSPLELTVELEQDARYTSATIPIHPIEFYQHPVEVQDQRTTINYVQVTLDAKDQYVIDRFVKYNALDTREGEDLLHAKFATDFNPITVSLSEIMKGEAEFLVEYKKLCAAVGQEPNDSALELYQAWYKARKFDLFKR